MVGRTAHRSAVRGGSTTTTTTTTLSLRGGVRPFTSGRAEFYGATHSNSSITAFLFITSTPETIKSIFTNHPKEKMEEKFTSDSEVYLLRTAEHRTSP